MFTSPEEELVSQGDKARSMSFIVNGNCFKIENDHSSHPIESKKLFSRGSLFGEIGILFDCNRTCTIKSIDYIILANLTAAKYKNICMDYPILKQIMLDNLYLY